MILLYEKAVDMMDRWLPITRYWWLIPNIKARYIWH